MAIALIENIQREIPTPSKRRWPLQRLLTEFELTHQQVAEAVAKSRTTVTNLLRLKPAQRGREALRRARDPDMATPGPLLVPGWARPSPNWLGWLARRV